MADSSHQRWHCSPINPDLALQQTLGKIIRKRCFSEAEIREFLRTPGYTDQVRNSIIKMIPEVAFSLRVNCSAKEVKKLSLLWIAVLGYYYKSAEMLVSLGADVNELSGLQEPFGLVLFYGAGIKNLDKNSTILHVLLRMESSPDNKRLIRLVVDHGADLEATDEQGRTVLHIAAMKSRVRMTEMLLEKGAKVNIEDDCGVTPLLEAANKDNVNRQLPLLISHGADVFAKDSLDHNVLHFLAENTFEQTVDLARVLIEKGVSLDDRDNEIQSQPIHLAVIQENKKLVELFLDHGADVNSLRKDGEFPLYLAVRWISQSLLKPLLERGASIDQRTTLGRTALHAACRYKKYANQLQEEAIELLVNAGADVLVEDCDGNTPLALIEADCEMKNPSVRLIIKALALKKVCLSPVELKDERIIKKYLVWLYYKDCIKEIDRMKLTWFVKTCTLFELLTRSHCQIADLMRNPTFETEFRKCDVSVFPKYAEDIWRAFRRAQHHYHATLEQEDVISEAFYNMLPDLVVRKIVRYMFNNCCQNVL
ncbi:poly [ADP-ribose] polymerase tankyrase-2-like [Nasonia vitripennis]|uniref:Uncharacterized protein n=1 Tax=Nasonia vitripennis TaxID=7425 RepID=A0A7M7QGI7_NASVI|nr:poly [ADP-ribose] polymerase tankyrase-2-like [Nasonia vitripennis]XP_031786361.1 poly [ADP-ribose] polymerase tankyrase-2-like [Nasonia vitripennis]